MERSIIFPQVRKYKIASSGITSPQGGGFLREEPGAYPISQAQILLWLIVLLPEIKEMMVAGLQMPNFLHQHI